MVAPNQGIACRCLDCGKHFTSRRLLGDHRCRYFEPDEDARDFYNGDDASLQKKTCRFCDATFPTRKEYTRHMPRCPTAPGANAPTQPPRTRPRVAASDASNVFSPAQHADSATTPFAILVGAENAKKCEDEIERRVSKIREVYASKCDAVSKEVDRRVAERTAEVGDELNRLMDSTEETRQAFAKKIDSTVEEATKSAMKLLEKAQQESQKAIAAVEGKCALKIAHAQNVHEQQIQKLRQEHEAKFEQYREEMHACQSRAMHDLRRDHEQAMSWAKSRHKLEVETLRSEFEDTQIESKSAKIQDVDIMTEAHEIHEDALQKLREEHAEEMAAIKEEHQEDLDVMNEEIERLEKLVLEYEKASDSGYGSHMPSDPAPLQSSETTTPSPRPCSPPSRGYRPAYGLTTGDVVTIYVGPPKVQEIFRIDRAYLTEVSSVFEGTLKAESHNMPGQFEEPQAEMKVYDFSPATFKIFRDWLLGRRLPARFRNVEVNLIEVSDDTTPQTELLNMYIFATEYDVPQLRRDALEAYMAWCTKTHTAPCAEEIVAAYASLPWESPMIKFMVDVCRHLWKEKVQRTASKEWTNVPAEFFRAILEVQAKPKSSTQRTFEMCDYHEH